MPDIILDGNYVLLEHIELDALINTVISSTIFFEPKKVLESTKILCNKIKKGEKVHARFSIKPYTYFDKDKNVIDKNSLNRDSAYIKSKDGVIYTKLDNRLYPILIDQTNNNEPKKLIKDISGLKVASGRNNNIRNYNITHVWGGANNPTLFTAMWNIVLMPSSFYHIMDKNVDEGNRSQYANFERKCQSIIQSICYNLYSESIEYEEKELEIKFHFQSSQPEEGGRYIKKLSRFYSDGALKIPSTLNINKNLNNE